MPSNDAAVFTERIRRCASLDQQKRLRSLIAGLAETGDMAPDSCGRAYVSFALGSLFFFDGGDGEAARHHYLKAFEFWTASEVPCQGRVAVPIPAHAAENLMLLSLSYDEYFSWSDELQHLAPNEPILHEHRPQTSRLRLSGQAWWQAMSDTASRHIQAMEAHINETVPDDPVKELRSYSRAAAITQLLLKYRTKLGLPREAYEEAANRYASLINLCYVQCEKIMRSATGSFDRQEVEFVIKNALPLIDEYLDFRPRDSQVGRLAGLMRGAVRS